MRAAGEMPEWPNGTDSKSVVLATVPRVQIPISPPLFKKPCNSMSYGAFSFLAVLLICTTLTSPQSVLLEFPVVGLSSIRCGLYRAACFSKISCVLTCMPFKGL